MGVSVSRKFEHLSPDFVDQNSHHSGMASSPFAKLSDFLARQIPADPHSDWHYASIVGPWEFQDPKKEAGYDLVGLYFVRIFLETKALHRPYRSFLDLTQWSLWRRTFPDSTISRSWKEKSCGPQRRRINSSRLRWIKMRIYPMKMGNKVDNHWFTVSKMDQKTHWTHWFCFFPRNEGQIPFEGRIFATVLQAARAAPQEVEEWSTMGWLRGVKLAGTANSVHFCYE